MGMTGTDFAAMFPSDDACLEHLKARFYPRGTICPQCRRASKFHRIRGRSAYSCQFCGEHVYPTAGTIFHRSTTSLRLWFWAIFLIASTRGRVSARQLERELGVTYKTARRMLTQIRAVLELDPAPQEPPTLAEARPPEALLHPRAWHGARRRA
jgi:transposase